MSASDEVLGIQGARKVDQQVSKVACMPPGAGHDVPVAVWRRHRAALNGSAAPGVAMHGGRIEQTNKDVY
eukprot:790193-Pleurochrysis_carterae.AAC.1